MSESRNENNKEIEMKSSEYKKYNEGEPKSLSFTFHNRQHVSDCYSQRLSNKCTYSQVAISVDLNP